MKTIDFLVQELPKLGGWPDGAIGAGFLCGEGTLYFWDESNDCPAKWRIDTEAEIEDSASETSREQYEAALAAKNEGWIEWGGGECPVPEGALVDVRYRYSEKFPDKMGAVAAIFGGFGATKKHWTHHGWPNDIIAYRPHKPHEATKADDEADLNECIGQGVAQVWDGEGKPTIGTKCEHHSGGQWEVVTIAGIHENLVTGFTDYWMVKEDGSSYTVGNPYRFRPIRSEADKKREDALDAIYGAIASAERAHNRSDEADKVYEAIAAGKIPGVKLED